jgi:hypothetical protein
VKCLLIAVVLLLLAAKAQTIDEEHFRIKKFEESWYPYLIKRYGCKDPSLPLNTENCSPARGKIDYKLRVKACEAAKELFELKGEC